MSVHSAQVSTVSSNGLLSDDDDDSSSGNETDSSDEEIPTLNTKTNKKANKTGNNAKRKSKKFSKKTTDKKGGKKVSRLSKKISNPNVHKNENKFVEHTFKFETKPMGFQIEAENGEIHVRMVRKPSQASHYGIEKRWQIIAVNGFKDWDSMLNVLETSLGPFMIKFRHPKKSTKK